MHRTLAILSLLLLTVVAAAQPLPDCYHTRQELYDFVLSLEDSFPGTFKVDSIGHSRGDMLEEVYPIYAVKVSDNVQEFEDEPVILIIGHIHAEEVAGLEATIKLLNNLGHHSSQNPYATLIAETQMYFIPTMNPDGLEVISLGWDRMWRKNGYQPPQVDTCVAVPGMGQDLCGVDLNRNFDLNWIYGDSLWQPGGQEPYDYYRGSSPFSEPEAVAVANFARQIKPTISLVWHSSRSGNVAERGIVAWQWGPDGSAKFSPDCTAIGQLHRGYLNKTTRYPGGQPYLEVWGATHNGDLQDWFYRELGCIQILTETSPPDGAIQPECDSLQTPSLQGLVSTLLPPMEWLCRRILNYPIQNDMSSQGSPLNIYTRNAQTLDSISAEWRIVNTYSQILRPWYTNEEHGRATFLPATGQVTVMARKEGFTAATATTSISPGGFARTVTLDLAPLPWYSLQVNVQDENGQPLSSHIFFDNGFPQTYELTSGTWIGNKPLGVCYLRIEPNDDMHLARWTNFHLDRDTTYFFVLPTAGESPLMSENFETGLGNWSSGGTNGSWRTDTDTTSLNYGIVGYTNPNTPTYRPPYNNNADAWLEYDNPIDLTGGNAFVLEFDRQGRLDMPADSFLVEVNADGINWVQAAGFSDLQVPWTHTFVQLDQWQGHQIYLRFRLKTDARLGDLGIHFDNIRVLSGIDLDAPKNPAPLPAEYRISKVYPNPFNPSTTIEFETAGAGPVDFAIHNLLGQVVWSSVETPPSAGRYEFRWTGSGYGGQLLPSGLYFLRMSHRGTLGNVHKLMLLK